MNCCRQVDNNTCQLTTWNVVDGETSPRAGGMPRRVPAAGGTPLPPSFRAPCIASRPPLMVLSDSTSSGWAVPAGAPAGAVGCCLRCSGAHEASSSSVPPCSTTQKSRLSSSPSSLPPPHSCSDQRCWKKESKPMPVPAPVLVLVLVAAS
jgi:hypothetical protein